MRVKRGEVGYLIARMFPSNYQRCTLPTAKCSFRITNVLFVLLKMFPSYYQRCPIHITRNI
uniref:Uncharacterized protein n=1 Tax=Meloidogyne incognita TaxID=6306 RepID=A0A914LFJ5_MELIC